MKVLKKSIYELRKRERDRQRDRGKDGENRQTKRPAGRQKTET